MAPGQTPGLDAGQLYLVEAVTGVASGIYVGVDLAPVVDVLPNPDDSGQDLGVFNVAIALPQTVAGVRRHPGRTPDQEG